MNPAQGIIYGTAISLVLWFLIWTVLGTSWLLDLIRVLFIVASGLAIAGVVHTWGVWK